MPFLSSSRPMPRDRGGRVRDAGHAIAICTLVLLAVLVPGCSDQENRNQTNESIIDRGSFPEDLLEDMQYKPLDLPMQGTPAIPGGLLLHNLTVGSLKDGNLLFQGAVDVEEGPAIQGYIIVQVEVLGNDSGVLRTSPPLVSHRNLKQGEKFGYAYLTTEPVGDKAAAYRISVQVSDRYPGV